MTECTGKDPGNVCGPMAGCFASSCCDSAGFCAPKDAPTCGGLIGEACPDGLVCVLDACVADAQGVCVTAEVAAELEASQGTCWTFSGGKP
ncbi:MAG: hypothetical protein D6705_06735 [Deltaproteobacteria bacterium]|nr:MAG: hypothetical protein D6705_06735 [Deltaproteobacteria bacterium]